MTWISSMTTMTSARAWPRQARRSSSGPGWRQCVAERSDSAGWGADRFGGPRRQRRASGCARGARLVRSGGARGLPSAGERSGNRPLRRRLGSRIGVHVELFAANRVVLIAGGIGTRPPREVLGGADLRRPLLRRLVTLEPTGVVLVRPRERDCCCRTCSVPGASRCRRRGLRRFRRLPGTRVAVFVNGRRWHGSPGSVPLTRHSEIVLEVGPARPAALRPTRSRLAPEERARAVFSVRMAARFRRGAVVRRLVPMALMPAGAFAVHQLRYWLAFHGHAGVELQRQGHAYLHSLVPWIVLVIALVAGAFLRALGRAFGGRCSLPRYTLSFAALWLACTASLVAIFVCQELLEGLFATGHPAGLAGVFGYGGWWSIPAAIAVGLVHRGRVPRRPLGAARGRAASPRLDRGSARAGRAGAAASRRARPSARADRGRLVRPRSSSLTLARRCSRIGERALSSLSSRRAVPTW